MRMLEGIYEMNRCRRLLVWWSKEPIIVRLAWHHIVVIRAWARYQQYGTPITRHGGSRSRATSAADDRYLVIQVRKNMIAIANQPEAF